MPTAKEGRAALNEFSFGPFRLDLSTQSLYRAGEQILLRPKLFALLHYLAVSGGRLVSKGEIVDKVWEGAAISDVVLTTCISELRAALGDRKEAPAYIQTVHRKGYRFIAKLTQGGVEDAGGSFPPARLVGRADASFVGRQAERAQLMEAWRRACQGERQLVFISGEAGVGKTRLIQAQVAGLDSTRNAARHGIGQCLPQQGEGEAFGPLLDALSDVARRGDRQVVAEVLSRHLPGWLAHLPALREPGQSLRSNPSPMTAERTLRLILDAIEELAQAAPLFLVFEDLHWSDGATVNLLNGFALRQRPAPVMILGSVRLEVASAAQHPVRGLVDELSARGLCHRIALGPFTEEETGELILSRLGTPRSLSDSERPAGAAAAPPTAGPSAAAELTSVVHQQAEGHPLFATALLDHLVARKMIEQDGEGWCLRADRAAMTAAVPESIRGLIQMRLDQLAPDDRSIVDAASVAGLSVPIDLFAAVLDGTAEGIEDAWARRPPLHDFLALDSEHGTCLHFRHVMHRQVSYDALGAARRRGLHGRYAQAMTADTVAAEQAGQIAWHWEAAGDVARAIEWRQQAADHASCLAAHEQALHHLHEAVRLVPCMGDAAARCDSEIDLQAGIARLEFLLHGLGSPGLKQGALRGLDLCAASGDSPRHVDLLRLATYAMVGHGEAAAACRFGHDLQAMVRRLGFSEREITAEGSMLGLALIFKGDVGGAQQALEAAIAALDGFSETPRRRWFTYTDPRIVARSHLAIAFACRGEVKRVAELCDAGADINARSGGAHPGSIVIMSALSCLAYSILRDWQAVHWYGERFLTHVDELGASAWRPLGQLFDGLATAGLGETELGLRRVEDALASWSQGGSMAARPVICALLGAAYLSAGKVDRARSFVAIGKSLADSTGLKLGSGELLRLEGACLAVEAKASGDAAPAQAARRCFEQAIEITAGQGAHLWHLRATLDLAATDPSDATRERLVPLLARFPSDVHLQDVRNARLACAQAIALPG